MADSPNARHFPLIEKILACQASISKKSRVTGSARSFDIVLTPVDMAYFAQMPVAIDPHQTPLTLTGMDRSLLETHTAMAVDADAAYKAQVEKGARDISAKGKAAIANFSAVLNEYMVEKTGAKITARYNLNEFDGTLGGHFHIAPQPATPPKIALFTAVIQELQKKPGIGPRGGKNAGI